MLGSEDTVIDPGRSLDDARISSRPDDDDDSSEKKQAKAEKKAKKQAEKAQQSDAKSGEREQKLRWDADKIQLKWVRLAILMVSIGIGADRTLLEMSRAGSQPVDALVIRALAQLIALVGIGALAIATLQHGRLLLAITRNGPMPVARFPLSLIVAIVIVILGLVAVVMAVTTLGSAGRVAGAAGSDLLAAGTAAIAVTATVGPASPTPDVRAQVSLASPAASAVVITPTSAAAASRPQPVPAPTTAAAPSPTAAGAAPVTLVVQGTGSAGARLRQEPVDGETIEVLADGTRLTVLGDATPAGDRSWQRVRIADGREGWIASDLVVAVEP